MREVGIKNIGRLSDPMGMRRLHFEVNASALGSLLKTHPDTWLDEYLLYSRMRNAGAVKCITEYREIFPSGQVEEASGDFDKVDPGNELICEVSI